MLNQIRGGIVKKIGETIRFAVPFGGINTQGLLELIGVDGNRIKSHEAFQIGGASSSKTLAITTTSGSLTFTAGAGRFLRILTTVDCYVRLDQPSVVAADDPATDGESIFFPFGATLFIVIPDNSIDAVISVKALSTAGTFYASVVV